MFLGPASYHLLSVGEFIDLLLCWQLVPFFVLEIVFIFVQHIIMKISKIEINVMDSPVFVIQL